MLRKNDRSQKLTNSSQLVRTITKDFRDHIRIPQVSTSFIDSGFLRSLVAPEHPSYDESMRCAHEINQDLPETASAIHVRQDSYRLGKTYVHLLTKSAEGRGMPRKIDR